MIKNIKEVFYDSDNKLVVEVECYVRKFATNPIFLLTTEQVIGRISSKYDIVSTIKTPSKIVANTNRNKMSCTGTWVFEASKKEEKIEKPKKTRSRKTTTSIRNRMSKLASKED